MESPKIYFLTYADSKYERQQNALCAQAIASGQFDTVIPYTRERFEKDFAYFYQKYRHILDQERGAGYWLWKPHIIMEMMKQLDEGDLLLYVDCGDKLADTDGMREALIELMKDKDVYFTDGAFKNGDWTKRDCFKFMKCDEEKYHNAIQLEAGIILCRAGMKALSIIWDWRTNCLLTQVLTDEPNQCTEGNLPGFKDHRHDQSVITNLKIRDNLPSGNALRKYIHCNQNN